jgi:chromosome segregation ATPase
MLPQLKVVESSHDDGDLPGRIPTAHRCIKHARSGGYKQTLFKMSENQLVLKGQACIVAARSAYDLIYTQKNMGKAAECLSALREDAVELQGVAEKNKESSATKERELEEEIDRLTKEKDGYDLTVSRLNEERRNEEYRLSQQRQTLSNAESDLCDARSMLADAEADLRRAREKEAATMTTAVTTGLVVGLFTFGIGGVIAGAGVGAGIAALINEIEGRVDKAKSRIRSRESDVSSAQNAISSTQQSLSNIQCRISDYNGRITTNERRMMELHKKISENKPSLAVHRQALELWGLLAQASENAAGSTKRLGEILQKADKKQNMKIVRSNGTVTIAKSFVEAWEEISFNEGRLTCE